MTAAEAYRRDLAEHRGAFSSADGDWIVIVSAVASASLADPAGERRLMRVADEAARDCFGKDELGRRARLEWRSRPRRADALVLLATAMQEAGAIHLAGALVDAALRTRVTLTPLQCARFSIQRAQVTYKLGDRELAAEQFRELKRLGRRMRNPELSARAALGLVSLAQLSGNYPDLLGHAREARRFARSTDLPRLRRRAAYAVMIGAAQLGKTDEALHRAWEMYSSAGNDGLERATSLVGIGQLLLRLREPAAAYSAFSAVVSSRLPSRVLLPALSGVAAAASKSETNWPDRVRWATREVERFRGTAAPPYAIAAALLECAHAVEDIGESEWGSGLRREGLDLAERHHFHQLAVEAERALAVEPRRRHPAQTTQITRHFDSRPKRRLPVHVQPAGDMVGVG